jgi:hypothetical protein
MTDFLEGQEHTTTHTLKINRTLDYHQQPRASLDSVTDNFEFLSVTLVVGPKLPGHPRCYPKGLAYAGRGTSFACCGSYTN